MGYGGRPVKPTGEHRPFQIINMMKKHKTGKTPLNKEVEADAG